MTCNKFNDILFGETRISSETEAKDFILKFRTCPGCRQHFRFGTNTSRWSGSTSGGPAYAYAMREELHALAVREGFALSKDDEKLLADCEAGL